MLPTTLPPTATRIFSRKAAKLAAERSRYAAHFLAIVTFDVVTLPSFANRERGTRRD
jgi:hypothetical protein